MGKMKYLDQVEVINDRDEYKKEGVTKGMIGSIMSAISRYGTWHVIFTDPKTACDIADLSVRIEDLKVVWSSNISQEELNKIVESERR
jgi:hypothetical protein